MAELKFAVLFSAIDQLSDKLGAIGEAMGKFTDRVTAGSERVAALGERMVEWGEKVGIATAVLSEGADRLHEWSDAASEPAFAMERSMATMSAMTDLGTGALDEIKRHAVEFSSIHPGVTAEAWISGFTRMRGIFQDTAKATKAEDTSAMLQRLGVESDAATRLIQVGWANLRRDATTTGDEVTRAIQVFGLAPEQANQFAMGVGRMGASAAAAHAPFSEVLALSGEAQRLLGDGRDATMFASMISGLETAAAKGKATIDFSHGLIPALQQLKAQLSGTPVEKLAELQKMGISSGPQMLKLLDNLGEVEARNKQIAASAGTLGKAYGTATANAADQTALLHQNINNLYDAIYTPALPTINRWLSEFTGVARGASGAAEHHSAVTRYAALSLTAVSSSAYYGLQGLAAFGTMTAFAGKGVQALGKLFDLQSHYLHVLYAVDKIRSFSSAIADVAGSLGTLGKSIGALLISPAGLWIAAIAATAIAAYEIYEHWGAVKEFFAKLWTGAKGYFTEFSNWVRGWAHTLAAPIESAWQSISDFHDRLEQGFLNLVSNAFHWGRSLVKSFAAGIWHLKDSPGEAVSWVAGKIRDLLPRSPAKEGPLWDLNRVRIVETIAETIRPAPLVASMTDTAAAIMHAMPTLVWPTALAPVYVTAAAPPRPARPAALPAPVVPSWKPVPLKIPALHALGIPTLRILALPMLHAPEIALPAVAAASITPAPPLSRAERHRSPGTLVDAPAGGTTINLTVNYAPVLNGAGAAEFDSRRHSDEITRLIKDKLTREARLRFE